MPAYRVRTEPAPGMATEQDVIDVHDRENRTCELVNGTLVGKTAGLYEAWLAAIIGSALHRFAHERKLGIVVGADGAVRLAPGLVRVPDASFVSWQRLPGGQVPREPIPDLVPDLAVEVLSKGNTAQEMDRKLQDYFSAGVRLVWYVDPDARLVRVYTSPTQVAIRTAEQALDGGDVLPGFTLPVAELFARADR